MADPITVTVVSQPVAAAAGGAPIEVNVGAAALTVEVSGAQGPPGPAGPFSRGASIVNTAGALTVVAWRAPFACTVTAVKGYRVGGTGAAVNARRSGAAHLAADLSLTNADQWMDGGAVQNAAYAAGQTLELLLASVAGGPTQIAIQVEFLRT